VTYDGNAHTATGGAVGVKGESLAGLNLSGTTHTNVGDYTADPWVFTDVTGNYNNAGGTVHDRITKANAIISAAPYHVTYDGNSHIATGSAIGAKGEALAGLDLSGTVHTNAANYATDVWTFTDVTGNYNNATGSLDDIIDKANAVINTVGYNVTYDGNAHTATGGAVGVKGESLAGLDLSGSTHTNVGDYTADPWVFTDVTGNYNNANGSVHDHIGKANALISVTPYSVTYDGNPHTATGTATGVNGVTLTGLNLSGTTHTNAGDYTADVWTFTDTTGNYLNASGTIHDIIAKANPVIVAVPYNVVYDGNPHTATGTATGVKGESLAGLDLSGTTHTKAGDYPADTWNFIDVTGNYNNASGTVHDVIRKGHLIGPPEVGPGGTDTITITPYNVTYDGHSHSATGTVIGMQGEILSGLDLSGTVHTNAGDYTFDTWQYIDVSGNYENASGTIEDIISKANATIVATPYNVVYDGNAHTASGSVVGVMGESLAGLDLSGTTHTNAGDYATDAWTFTDVTGNYNNASGTVHDIISKANPTISVTPYSTTYDGNSHTATGTAVGVNGTTLTGLDLSGTTHTNAGTYPDTWTFTDTTGNYNNASGCVTDIIAKANATINVTPYNVTYDANAHTATGTVTGVNGVSLTGLNLSGTTHTNAGTYAGDAWTFTDITGNYNNANGTVTDIIAKANATINVTPYNVTYDANAHTATGTVTGVNGVSLTGLNLSGTTHTNAGTYKTDAWTFTDSTGNYNNASGTVIDVIAKATPKVTVTPYSVTYDGNSHTATGSVTGVNGTILSGLNLSGTTHTNAGTYSGDAWTFTDSTGNYNNASGTVTDVIAKANPTITVTPYSVTYDGNAHTATGTATGVNGTSLTGLNLTGTTHTNAGTYSGDAWTFTDSTGNYNNASGTVTDVIAKANPTITVTPYNVTYDGNSHTATGTVTGINGTSLTGLSLSGTTHTNAGTYSSDTWTFTDVTGNYNNASGTVTDVIAKANPTITVTPYTVLYDGNPHTATGTATGIGGVSLSGLSLTGTTHTNAGDYPTDAWTFTDATGNYNNANGTVHDSIGQYTPYIGTTPGGTITLGSGNKLTDTATLSGGFNPTGTITFTLYNPSNAIVYTNTVTVSGNGTYTTSAGNNPGGYLPTTAGTYQWVASYSGDDDNASVADAFGNEPESVIAPPNLTITKTADQSAIGAGQTAGYLVTISNTGGSAATGVSLSDPLPAGTANDINWTIDISGTGKGAGTNPTDFQITGGVGSQSLVLSSTFITTLGDSLAAGQTISVHITGATSTNDTTSTTNPALGLAGNYGLLYSGGHNLALNNSTFNGYIGISGSGAAQFSGPLALTGRVDFSAANTGQYHSSGNVSAPTSINYNVAAVTTALNTVSTLSNSLAGQGTNIAINGTQTINESAGQLYTVNGFTYRVFNVTSYSETDGKMVTINGDGSGNAVVFNFGLSSNVTLGGDVTLTGGLSDDQVLWNFSNSGYAVSLHTNASSFPQLAFHGVIMAPNDTISADNSNLNGRIFGGGSNDMQIVSGDTVNAPLSSAKLVNTATATANLVSPVSASAMITVQPILTTPAIVTLPGDTITLGSGEALSDSAILSGGNNPGGTITFTLYNPTNAVVYTDVVPVSGNGIYSTSTGSNPGGFLPTTAGTYQWVASYSGDAQNAPASDSLGDEPEAAVVAPSLTITKTADQSSIFAGQTAGFVVTIANTGGSAATGFSLRDPLPSSAGGDINWTIDTSGTGKGAGTTPADFQVTGGLGSQLLSLSTYFTNTLGGSLAAGQSISVHITTPTNQTDAVNGKIPVPGFDTTGTTAASSINLGMLYPAYNANTYTVFGLYNTTINNSLASVHGDVGLSQGGTLVNGTSSMITRNVYDYQSGQYSGAGVLGGSVYVAPTQMTDADANALQAASAAKALPANYTFSGGINTQTTINAVAGGLTVVQINGNINLSKASIVLTGSASDVFVVNVTGSATFTGSGGLTLGGNVTANHVLYNFTGLSGTFSATATNVFYGTLLAPNYNLTIYGNYVGEIIAGGISASAKSQSITLQSSAQVDAGSILSNTATVSVGNTPAGSASATVLIQPTNLPSVTVSINYGVVPNDFATIGFWHNNNGQALINSLNGGSTSTALAQWLATTFPNLYGPTAGATSMAPGGVYLTNAQVAALYNTSAFITASGMKYNAQILGVALATYVTSSNLAGGTMAKTYGFNVSTNGTGYDTYNVGSNGAAYGVANGTVMTVLNMLQAVNNQAVKGVLYANAGSSQKTYIGYANIDFSAINQTGDITGVTPPAVASFAAAVPGSTPASSSLTVDGTAQNATAAFDGLIASRPVYSTITSSNLLAQTTTQTATTPTALAGPTTNQSINASGSQLGATLAAATLYAPGSSVQTIVSQDGPVSQTATEATGTITNKAPMQSAQPAPNGAEPTETTQSLSGVSMNAMTGFQSDTLCDRNSVTFASRDEYFAPEITATLNEEIPEDHVDVPSVSLVVTLPNQPNATIAVDVGRYGDRMATLAATQMGGSRTVATLSGAHESGRLTLKTFTDGAGARRSMYVEAPGVLRATATRPQVEAGASTGLAWHEAYFTSEDELFADDVELAADSAEQSNYSEPSSHPFAGLLSLAVIAGGFAATGSSGRGERRNLSTKQPRIQNRPD
jgi:hypothetical protein